MDDAKIPEGAEPVAEAQDAKLAIEYPPGEYGIVDLFGHTKMVGRVSEVERFGAKMLCVEVIFENQLLPPVFHGGSAIYGLTPCSAEVAFRRQAAQDYYLPANIRATLTTKALPSPIDSYPSEQYGPEDEGREEDDGKNDF